MTEYRKKSDGTIVVGDVAFRQLFPNTSFPKILTEEIVNDFGYDYVLSGTEPSVTPPYEYVVRDGVEEKSGKWYTKFKAITMDTSAKARLDADVAAIHRPERDILLKESDWTQLADKGALSDSKVTEWATYRQSLRDLPTASGWPHTHTWPTKPS